MLIKYYQSYENYFWQWEDGAEVVSIPYGSTIAYRKVIVDIVNEMAFLGLPSFDALLLVMTALNPNGSRDLDYVKGLLQEKFLYSRPAISGDENFDFAFDFLQRITNINEKYKSGRGKLILLKAIFKNCHNALSLKESDKISKLYIEGSQSFLEKKEFAIVPPNFHKTIQTLAIINKNFPTIDSIMEKMIDLPETEEPIILEEPISIDSEDLIENLINDSRTFKVGALVKQIWSGLNLPFHKSSPSQMPIGGVSDLTNKGNYDQLLISEYANDDLTFLSRLANNEALFLNRESPPSTNDLKRVILVDVSMRNWGTPKTVAFATMLAIAKHPKSDFECEVFVVGDHFQSIKIDSVHEVVSGLQKVEATLNSAKGIEEYFNLFPSGKNREVFLITEKTVPFQNEMSKILSDFGDEINYLIFNDSNGQIDIYKKLKKSKKHIQHLEIPLERLWEKKTKTKTVSRSREKNDFYPILVKPPQQSRGIVKTENGEFFQITKDRTLLRFFDKKKSAGSKGWEIVHEKLRISSNDFEVGIMNNGDYILLTFNPQNREVRILNLNTKKEKKFYFDQWRKPIGQSFVFHNEHFYYYYINTTWKIDVNGNIEKLEFEKSHKEIYDKKEKDINENRNRIYNYQNLLKKLNLIGISDDGRLAFNGHELVQRQGNHLKLVHNPIINYAVLAQWVDVNYYQFPDGSTVELINPGLFIFKSSDDSILPIYLPSVLDMSGGIANEKYFAGNKYFKREKLFELNFEKSGTNRMASIKFIKYATDFGLKDARKIMEEAPHNLLTYFNKAKVLEVEDELKSVGAEVEVIDSNPQFREQNEIDVPVFFTKFITPFIQRILDNGT